MKPRTMALVPVFMASSAMLVACSGDSADDGDGRPQAAAGDTELDCRNIEVMVPYSPGGGSDRQVRRLEPHLAESLGTDLNIVYREGAAGATAWNELKGSEPDGCTVANVVVPNILISAEVDDAPFAADEFTYLGFTEQAPNAIAVPNDSEFGDIAQFIQAAQEAPGELIVAGSGQGPLATEQFMAAAGIDVTFIPMEGGASGGLQTVQAGDADAVNFSSSHVVEYSDTVRALALSGTERSPASALEGVPTMAELGYEGFGLVAMWGLIAPPETPEGIVQTWNDALNSAVETEEVQQALIDGGLTPMTMSADEAADLLADELEAFDPSAHQ